MIDYILHLDTHLRQIITQYGPWTYGIFFLIVFCETGLVVAPFLPGDSLLFAAGIFCHPTEGHIPLNPWLVSVIFIAAAFAGDNLNYQLGMRLGRRMFKKDHRLLKRKHLDKTEEFYQKYGPKAVIIARFVPVVRTFSPFVAGMGAMPYGRFVKYSLLGASLWVGVFVPLGFVLGNAIKSHFELVVILIMAISVLPIAWELIHARIQRVRTGK